MLKLMSMACWVVVLAGCANVGQDQATPGHLAGYWKSAYGDGFEITGTSFQQYDDATKALSFAGTIVNSPNTSAASGGLTLQVTNSGTWGKTVGKFLVVRWKGLTATGVQQSTPYINGASSESGVDTAGDAEVLFTVAHGYFSMFADYQLQ